jgi:hypothetical protein
MPFLDPEGIDRSRFRERHCASENDDSQIRIRRPSLLSCPDAWCERSFGDLESDPAPIVGLARDLVLAKAASGAPECGPLGQNRSRVREMRSLLASFLAYCAALLPFAWTWIAAADRAVPRGALLVSPADARLQGWVLAWVSHALATDPLRLYDPPVAYPAPGQLAGTDHYLSSQLLFAPVFAATGNALLGANVVALASYPLAALAMQRLLMALGAAALPSWVAGLVFMLGPMRVPGNLQLLQYLNLYLPLAALCVTRVRRRPTAGRALLLALVLAAGALSSYYLAVMLALVGVLWTGLELHSRAPARWRFVTLALAAALAALVPLTAISAPYFARIRATERGFDIAAEFRENPDVPGAADVGAMVTSLVGPVRDEMLREPAFWGWVALAFLRVLVFPWFGPVALALAALGLFALRARSPVARRLAHRGLVIALVAFPLVFVPLNFAVGQTTGVLAVLTLPFRLFRLPYRFVVVVGFGTALLAAAALEAARSAFGARRGAAMVVAAGAGVLATAGVGMVGHGLDEVHQQRLPIYDEVREVAASTGGGPLIEMPHRPEAAPQRAQMLAAIRHGQPIVDGVTGYSAEHRDVVEAVIARLPADEALTALVDMTHLRWLLLRPLEDWPQSTARAELLALPGVRVVLERDGWALARVDRTPGRPEWFAAIAAGNMPR